MCYGVMVFVVVVLMVGLVKVHTQDSLICPAQEPGSAGVCGGTLCTVDSQCSLVGQRCCPSPCGPRCQDVVRPFCPARVHNTCTAPCHAGTCNDQQSECCSGCCIDKRSLNKCWAGPPLMNQQGSAPISCKVSGADCPYNYTCTAPIYDITAISGVCCLNNNICERYTCRRSELCRMNKSVCKGTGTCTGTPSCYAHPCASTTCVTGRKCTLDTSHCNVNPLATCDPKAKCYVAASAKLTPHIFSFLLILAVSYWMS